MESIKYQMVRSEHDRFWTKYCGFLDLSVEEFMAIQQALLLQQLSEIARCPLGRKLMGNKIPTRVDEFRKSIPLTTYEDYLPDLEQGNEGSLPEKPYVWAHTSGSSGFKQVPYTLQFYNEVLDNLMAVFVLACSKNRGRSSIVEGDRVLFNVAPSPYMSGILAHGANEKFNLKPVVLPDLHDGMDFKEKIAKGFEVSLQTGVDILIAMTSVLVKMGNDFNNHSKNGNGKLSKYLLHPNIAYRYGKALLKSKLEKRSVLPKDLWPVKAVIGWGIDTNIYRELVYKYWGKYPYEFHACTEAGIIAVQSWNNRDLTFIPHSNFFEFIPEAEWLENKRNSSYQPSTVLLSEVKPNERYELVITSFHQMPFVRYRLGHLIRITSLEDEEAQVHLPQMVFEARADDLIDIAGFTRISEKAVAQAITNSGLNFEEWSIRKEVKRGKPRLHLYIELKANHDTAKVASILDKELRNVDCFYRDLALMLDIHPLEVTLLRPGTFKDYYELKREAGAELSQRKPARMNTPDNVIEELLCLGIEGELKLSSEGELKLSSKGGLK
jgi:hypothetical protein